MASSPTSAASDPAFALQEITACWDQGYEALLRGDLDRVAALLTIVEGHLEHLDAADLDRPELAVLQRQADAARGRLAHGMKAGLDGLLGELKRARNGSRALNGYRDSTRSIGQRVVRDA
ncbi:MAG: hypothetical protein KDC98_18560 [Planctomycetes bacterium]|nr:hypothetical protein [Planctomycetota bacterium]